tara:strand:- start:2064 stop:2285 length:222 start_codon:yes stop_codon:yes gene_type:complete
MASSKNKKLTEEQLHEGLVSGVLKLILKGKLKAIERMGLPDDVKKHAKEADKAFKSLGKSLKKAERTKRRLKY